jgi:hypothetical protein
MSYEVASPDYSHSYYNTFVDLTDYYNDYDDHITEEIKSCGREIAGLHPSKVDLSKNNYTCTNVPTSNPAQKRYDLHDINLDTQGGYVDESFTSRPSSAGPVTNSAGPVTNSAGPVTNSVGPVTAGFTSKKSNNILDDPIIKVLLFAFIIYMIYSVISLKLEINYLNKMIMFLHNSEMHKIMEYKASLI